MPHFTFTTGDVEEALDIIREAASWLIDQGRPLWPLTALTFERLEARPEDYIVMRDGQGNTVAAVILSFYDPLFWPDMAPGNSGFIHKLAVRRRFSGQQISRHLLDHVIARCREQGLPTLCLDCDADRASLRRFYEKSGFVFQGSQPMVIPHVGSMNIALYKMTL